MSDCVLCRIVDRTLAARILYEDDLVLAVNVPKDHPARIARQLGIDASGYRLTTNTGEDAGQTVFHLHLHCLGGRKLGSEA
jgi:histidine triad (HIT) family protein